MDHHDDDPTEQLRRAQARQEAEHADSSRDESLGPHDTQEIPVVRTRRRRRWAIGAAVAALLAAGIAVPALAAGGPEPAAGGEPAQVQPADVTPTAGPTDAPSGAPAAPPADAPSGAPAAPGACPGPPAPGHEAPKPPAPGKDAPKPPVPGQDAPMPPAAPPTTGS